MRIVAKRKPSFLLGTVGIGTPSVAGEPISANLLAIGDEDWDWDPEKVAHEINVRAADSYGGGKSHGIIVS